jgi:phospholipid/cholesterol/gamma-HCH transport system permease protein
MQQDKQKHYFLLPERLSIEDITLFFKKIKRLGDHDRIELDFKEVVQLDSSAIALVNVLKRSPVEVTFINVAPEFQRRLSLFQRVVTESSGNEGGAGGAVRKRIEAAGDHFFTIKGQVKDFLVLLADEISYTFQYLLRRRGVYPGEIANQLFFMGYKSFPIVSLIAFLVGVTISVTSAEQLRTFGAEIYLADLVGFGMIRELVPLMTGIILAGKIGASITAEIASMKVLEETDALKTMGIMPEKFLMVPRLIAITLAIPLLVAIADFVGIFAGVLVARVVSGIPPGMFFTEMFTVVEVGDFLIGLVKTLVFGWLVVVGSGYKGFSVKRGAAGVGIATTESVVLSISMIIIFDCIFALILY